MKLLDKLNSNYKIENEKIKLIRTASGTDWVAYEVARWVEDDILARDYKSGVQNTEHDAFKRLSRVGDKTPDFHCPNCGYKLKQSEGEKCLN